MRPKTHSRPPAAFSLIELIVVISIIGIIAVFAIPAASTIVMGTEMTRASQIVEGQFGLARQTAITKNHSIEVRLLFYGDPEQPGEVNLGAPTNSTNWNYHAISLMEVLENGVRVALGKPERLPGSILIANDSFTSFIDTSGETGTPVNGGTAVAQQPLFLHTAGNADPPLPRMDQKNAQNYKYRAFTYNPDGSTNLDPRGKWYLTLVSRRDLPKINNAAPGGNVINTINYFTVQVDPTSGSVKTYRPSLH